MKTYGAWNEANHVSAADVRRTRASRPSTSSPLRSVCRSCSIVAADVLDSKTCRPGCAKFKRNAKGKARIYGLHNYARRQPQALGRAPA